ncbi:MAG: signal recognition particle protein [Ruminococcaceae bacterium]|nr:signal recognition particle protein [Oscillospiraceae bacterium]
MFQSLMDKMAAALGSFKNKGKLTPADVKAGMRQIKLALLEADVNFKVVKEFVSKVSERAVGAEVLESLLPHQQVVKIVREELIAIMGEKSEKLSVSPKPPTVIMMCGLQGSGKTTHSAKLAKLLKKQGKRPILVACDVYRPAAITQLKVVGEQVETPVFSIDGCKDVVRIAREGVKFAEKGAYDTVILDTAGRLHIDEELMDELKRVKAEVAPTEILLVVDAMTGQDAVNVAESFNGLLDITGVILTKLDGDTRGGAALSVRHVTGKPIKFIGVGEKLDQIEPFYPDRMASRIIGMGDVMTLIDKAEAAFDEKKAREMEQKLRQNSFTLEDYMEQFDQLKNMGSLEQIMGMLPGMKAGALKDVNFDEKQIDRTKAIIQSMTPRERQKPDIINASRRRRIAAGCGQTVEDVNRLLRQYEQMNKMMKQLTSKKGKFGRMKFPF